MVKLTDRFAKLAIVPEDHTRRDIIFYDEDIKGFGLRVTRAGSKSFMINYTTHAGDERRITLGRYPAWSVAAAREEAARQRRIVDTGGDPRADKIATRNEPTIRDLWARYQNEGLDRKAATTQNDERRMWEQDVLPTIGSMKIGKVEYADIDRLHRKVSERAPYVANRMVASIRYAFNLARKWKWAVENPATSIRLNHEEPRAEYLRPDEIRAYLDKLRSYGDNASALALQFILITGCRKGEAFRATWDQFDLDEAVWTKPSSHTKQNKLHRVPMSDLAIQIVTRARQATNGEYVFPGRLGEPLTDVKKLHTSILKQAGLRHVRIHDLRHSFASALISGGQPLATLGSLMGHTQSATTMRYAHLYDAPMRAAANVMSDIVGVTS